MEIKVELTLQEVPKSIIKDHFPSPIGYFQM